MTDEHFFSAWFLYSPPGGDGDDRGSIEEEDDLQPPAIDEESPRPIVRGPRAARAPFTSWRRTG